MNKILTLLTVLLAFNLAEAQIQKANYSLEFNEATCKFEVYAHILEGKTKNVIHRAQLNSQVSLVTPLGTQVIVGETFMPLKDNQQYRSGTAADWEVTTVLDGPAVTPNKSYHSITPVVIPAAYYMDMKAGDKVKLFAIDVEPMVNCASDIRLFDNQSDPKSNEPSMVGGDFRNGYTVGSLKQSYNANETIKLPTKPQIGEFTLHGGNLNVAVDYTKASNCQSDLDYSWYNGDKLIKSGAQAPSLSKAQIETGKYSLIVKDGLGCTDTKRVVLAGSQLDNEEFPTVNIITEPMVSLYPNPAKNYTNLTVEGANGKSVVANIINADGKVMKSNIINTTVSSQDESYRVSLQGLVSGVYNLSVNLDGNSPSNHKLIIVH